MTNIKNQLQFRGNYGLAKLMDEVIDDERLSSEDAKRYYQSLKQN
ncbi:MAG: hypothetical protein Q7J76_09995 [Candidatus Brocadiaceae bacterium]|nr:hypothetical protein [Candidatus Brocadiaceae bacterium]